MRTHEHTKLGGPGCKICQAARQIEETERGDSFSVIIMEALQSAHLKHINRGGRDPMTRAAVILNTSNWDGEDLRVTEFDPNRNDNLVESASTLKPGQQHWVTVHEGESRVVIFRPLRRQDEEGNPIDRAFTDQFGRQVSPEFDVWFGKRPGLSEAQKDAIMNELTHLRGLVEKMAAAAEQNISVEQEIRAEVHAVQDEELGF